MTTINNDTTDVTSVAVSSITSIISTPISSAVAPQILVSSVILFEEKSKNFVMFEFKRW